MLHQPHTELQTGGVVTAACSCGWRRLASSHEHSWAMGKEHKTQMENE